VNVHGATLDERPAAALRGHAGRRRQGAGDRNPRLDRRRPRCAPWLEDARVDRGGRYLLPGLIDAHGHMNNLGKLRIQANLVGSSSLGDALARIRAYAAAHPDSPGCSGAAGTSSCGSRAACRPRRTRRDRRRSPGLAAARRRPRRLGQPRRAARRRHPTRHAGSAGGRIERDAQANRPACWSTARSTCSESAIPPLPKRSWRAAGCRAGRDGAASA
jgi:hypothetical protein